MEPDITPDEVRRRAARALITMDDLFGRAGISGSTFWRWEQGTHTATLLTKEKLRQALEGFERERAA